jgi:hypothetical protein
LWTFGVGGKNSCSPGTHEKYGMIQMWTVKRIDNRCRYQVEEATRRLNFVWRFDLVVASQIGVEAQLY